MAAPPRPAPAVPRRAALAAALIALAPSRRAGANAYTDLQSVAFGPTADGRVRACPSATGSNCVSTSNTSDLYGPPFIVGLAPAAAADALAAAAPGVLPGARLLSRDGLFLTLGVPSARGKGEDTLEVLLKEDAGGDAAGGPRSLVLFRAVADPSTIQYLFPLQTPISDGGAQRARVRALAAALGWRPSGCDLLECFAER